MSSSPWAKVPTWTKRLERARTLSEQNSWAREVLSFYAALLEFQKSIYDQTSAPAAVGTLRQQLDFAAAQEHVPRLLSVLRRYGPEKLRQQATEIAGLNAQETTAVFTSFFNPDHEFDPPHLLARMVLQPMAERLAEASGEVPASVFGNKCPRCEGEPQLAVIRPEGDGGKRSLLCSFCQTEWEFRRILCPVCGEEDNAKLPRYVDENNPAVRVEACDTCHSYLKSLDLTVDGRIVPLVDEVATAPLDLWAAEKGCTKVVPNVLGF